MTNDEIKKAVEVLTETGDVALLPRVFPQIEQSFWDANLATLCERAGIPAPKPAPAKKDDPAKK
jgi:hypothetical protein